MAESKEKDTKKPRTPLTRSTWLYIGSIVILIIVVVTFIGAPVATSTMGSSRLVFGRYGGEDILYQPGNFFARQYEVVAQSLRDSGDTSNIELQLRLAWREAFNRTVLHKAVQQAAGSAGMTVSESRIDEMVAQDPRFLVNGRFDAAAYRNTSNQEQFALRNFHRENARFDQVIQDTLTVTPFSTAEREFVATMTGPQRSFEVVRFPFSEFPEEQVRQYVSENENLFTRLDLAVITLADRDEAERIRDDATTPGNPFGNLARTYSRDLYADQDGEIGEIYGHELQQELVNPDDLDVILALSEGDISSPVETTSGWSIYQAVAPASSPVPDEDAIIAEARSYMQMFEQGRIQDFVRAEAENFAVEARTSGLETAVAQADDRDILTTGFFPINYGNNQFFGQIESREIPELSDAAYREQFFTTAFSLDSDDISEPVILRESALVLKLADERPASEEDQDFITEYYDAIARQFYSREIETTFIDQDKLQDNFNQAFNRYVLGN
jgi:peptidyl-prolyl cis-trans isomerase D